MLQVLEARGGGQSAKVLRVESHGGRQQAVKVIDHSASGLSPKLLADELTNWPPLRHESLVQFFGQLELGASYTRRRQPLPVRASSGRAGGRRDCWTRQRAGARVL